MAKKEDISKIRYAASRKIESFYNGGPIAVTKCGSSLFTNFGTKVNCVDFNTGLVKYAIEAADIEDEITAFALSPSDDFLIVAYRNLLLVQFRLTNNDQQHFTIERTWKSGHRGPVTCLAFTDDARLMASGSADSTVKVWDLEAQYCTHTLKDCTGCVTCVSFAPVHFQHSAADTDADSQPPPPFVAYGDDGGRVFARRLQADAGTAVVAKNHASAVTALVFGPNGRLYTAARDSVVAALDVGRQLATDKLLPVFESVETMLLCDTLEPRPENDTGKRRQSKKINDGVTLLTAGQSGSLKIWSTATGRCIRELTVAKAAGVTMLLQCDTRRCFLAAVDDQTIVVVSTDDFSMQGKLIGHNDEIYDVAFCGADDPHKAADLAAVATNSSDVRLYDLATGQCQLLTDGHTNAVLSLDVAPFDKNLLASCSKDNTTLLWRLKDDHDGAPRRTSLYAEATGHAGAVNIVRFSRLVKSKQRFLATAGDDCTLKLWLLPSETTKQSATSGVGGSDGGRLRLTASATVVAHEKGVTALDVAPNDRFLATGSMDKQIKLWTVDSSKHFSISLIKTINDHKRGIFDVRFSPIDQVLASASGDFTIKIFSLDDFSCIKTFEGHQSAVLRVNFVANGSQLVSTDTAGIVRLWTIRTGECAQSIDAHENKIFAMACSSADAHRPHRLLTGGADGRLVLWTDVGDERRREAAEASAAKTADEQRLRNLEQAGRLTDALRLALRLSRPFDAFNLTRGIVERAPQAVATNLDDVLSSLPVDQLALLLQYACEWNSNSRHFLVAQNVLASALRVTPPESLLQFPNINQTIEAFLPYSERHFERLSRARVNCCFADYTWSKMRLDDRQIHTTSQLKVKREI